MLSNEILSLAEFIRNNDLYPSIVRIEYSLEDLLLSDSAMTAKRLGEYMLAQTVNLDTMIRFCGVMRFDGSVMSDVFHRTGHPRFNEVANQYFGKPQENLAIFVWQHATANFAKVIDCGIAQYIAEIDRALEKYTEYETVEFLQAMRTTCENIIAWAHKCADICEDAAEKASGIRRTRLLDAASMLRHVPEFPARNFREGIQTLYLCFDFLPDSIGLIDRSLQKLYNNDIADGTLTREEAADMLAELFVRVCAHTPMTASRSGDKGAESHFAIGGILADGTDGYTELSDLIVDTMMELPLPRPQTSLRITKKTPFSVVRKLLDCARRDPYMRFAFVGDEPRLRGLTEIAKIPWEDAVNYTMVGCNEPALRGSIWLDGCTSNIARSLTNLLYNRTDTLCDCENFDAVFALWEEELEKDIQRLLWWINGFHRARAKDKNVLSSIFIDGCIESGKSVTECGGKYSITGTNMMGLTCVIDSLSIINQLVFEEKYVTMRTLIDILQRNWEGDDGEELRCYILKKGRFSGNNDELSDTVARRFTDALWHHTKDKTDMYGNHILIGTLSGYNPYYVWLGALTDATPDGRKKGDAFMVGAGQTAEKDRNGLTALLTSVAEMDPHAILSGPFLCNAYLDEALVMKDENFEKTAQIIYHYFMCGGMHIQLNYVSKEELLKAKEHPENYPTLRVRVSGFSGNFTNLNEAIQDDVIRRTVVNGR